MKNIIQQIASTLVFGAFTLTTYAQSSGGSGSDTSDFMAPPSSFIASIMSGEMVEGSFGSVQNSGEVASQALAFSAKTGENIFITSFTLMKEVVQITVEASAKGGGSASEASQNTIEFVLTAPRSIFREASLASSNGENLISNHAKDYNIQYEGAEISTVYVPVDPIPLRVEPFKVGHEKTLAGHTLTVKVSPPQLNQLDHWTAHNNTALPLQMMVLNDIGYQLYGQ